MHGYTMYQGCILYIVIFIFEKFKQRSSTITPISKKLKTTSLLKQLYTKDQNIWCWKSWSWLEIGTGT